jgi:hypothetical protein
VIEETHPTVIPYNHTSYSPLQGGDVASKQSSRRLQFQPAENIPAVSSPSLFNKQLLIANAITLYRPRRHAVQIVENGERFPVYHSSNRKQAQGTASNYKVYLDLCTGTKYRSVSVALARKKQRSICFFLDFL